MRKPNSTIIIIVLLDIFHIIHPQKQKRSVQPFCFWGEHSKGLSNQADVELDMINQVHKLLWIDWMLSTNQIFHRESMYNNMLNYILICYKAWYIRIRTYTYLNTLQLSAQVIDRISFVPPSLTVVWPSSLSRYIQCIQDGGCGRSNQGKKVQFTMLFTVYFYYNPQI